MPMVCAQYLVIIVLWFELFLMIIKAMDKHPPLCCLELYLCMVRPRDKISRLAKQSVRPRHFVTRNLSFDSPGLFKLLTSQQQPKWVVVLRSIKSASVRHRTGSSTSSPV